MIIDIQKLSPDGNRFEVQEPGSILELEKDKFAHEDGMIDVDVYAQLVSRELVVRGSLRVPIRLLCSRCAGFFSTTLNVSSFLRAYPVQEGMETVDITADIREDILLEIPTYPSCPWKGTGVCPHSGVNLDEMTIPEPPSQNSTWDVLDRLKDR